MSAHGKNTKDSIGQRTSSKSTSMNVEESKVTSDKQSSQSYTNASDTTVGLPLALEDKLKKSLPGFGIEQSVKAFFVHSLYGTTLPNHFEVSKDELVLMASIVDEKILDMGKNEGKVLKTSDGQSVTMDELLGWRKQGGRSPEVMKMLYDKQIQLEEKDVELKQLKADLEEKRRLAEEQAVMTSNVKAKVEILKETIGNLEEENMCICKKYDSEKNMFETETRNLKSVINDKNTMIQQFEMQMELYNLDYNELQKKLKASEERFELQRENFKQYINELQEKLNASEKKCQNLSGQVKREQKTNEFMKADHEDEIRKINSQIKDLIAERDDLKHRFRKLAGDKLTDQSPDIADLSDPYRAMKLSDKFGELYDDQWTDAFEALQMTKKNTREAIDILLNALQRCEDFFKRLREDQMDSLTNILLYPSQNISKIGTDARKRVGV